MSRVRVRRPLGPEASRAACHLSWGLRDMARTPGRLNRKFPQGRPSRSLEMSSENSRLEQVRVRKREHWACEVLLSVAGPVVSDAHCLSSERGPQPPSGRGLGVGTGVGRVWNRTMPAVLMDRRGRLRESVGSEGSKVSVFLGGGPRCAPWFWLMVEEGRGRAVRWTMCAAWALPLAWKPGLWLHPQEGR